MKLKDVEIGAKYYTNIGSELAAVIVIDLVPGIPGATFASDRRDRFRVQRVGASTPLSKLRSAAALREKNEKFF